MNFLLFTLGSTISISSINYIYNNIFPINNNIENVIDTIIDKTIDNEINELMNIEFPKIDKKTEIYIDDVINPQINNIINKSIDYINHEYDIMNIEI